MKHPVYHKRRRQSAEDLELIAAPMGSRLRRWIDMPALSVVEMTDAKCRHFAELARRDDQLLRPWRPEVNDATREVEAWCDEWFAVESSRIRANRLEGIYSIGSRRLTGRKIREWGQRIRDQWQAYEARCKDLDHVLLSHAIWAEVREWPAEATTLREHHSNVVPPEYRNQREGALRDTTLAIIDEAIAEGWTPDGGAPNDGMPF